MNQRIVDSVFPSDWSRALRTGAGMPIDVSHLPYNLEAELEKEEEALLDAEIAEEKRKMEEELNEE